MLTSPKRGTKRVFIECSKDMSPTPFKKHKLNYAIRNMKQSFNVDKLQINSEATHKAAEDELFTKQPSSKQSQYIRWVIACKFIIASGLRLDSYDVLGMSRTKIPRNMYFYVDNDHNLCLVIHDTQLNANSLDIIKHCNKIETSVVQTYYGMDQIAEYIQQRLDEEQDYDLWIDTKELKESKESEHVDMINIIRVPMSYYSFNIASSFYSLCCRIAKHLLYTEQNFGHPLFQLLLRNIANFDCFQMSVPMVPLKGSLYSMFCKYGCGVYHDKDINIRLNMKEFTAFLGAYDCWNEIERKKECRTAMHQCWAMMTNTDINIMKIVIEFADLHEMSDERVLDYVNQFDTKSTKYTSYFNELKSQINCLESIIN